MRRDGTIDIITSREQATGSMCMYLIKGGGKGQVSSVIIHHGGLHQKIQNAKLTKNQNKIFSVAENHTSFCPQPFRY
jgi:hypothetical protein